MNVVFSDGMTLYNYTTPGISPRFFICKACGKTFIGGEIIQGEFYCPMCASIIKANNARSKESSWINTHDSIPQCCRNCKNHPINGGSGICHCILGQQKMY